MKTLRVVAVYSAAYEMFDDVITDLPRFIDGRLQLKTAALGVGLSQPRAVRGSTCAADGQNSSLILSTRRGTLQGCGTN